MSMRRSLHPGGRLPVEEVLQEIPEEVFHPEAAKTDGNPFPEEIIDYNSLTVEELRALCRARDLAITGKKAELVARLMEADAPSEEAVSSDETGSVSNESEPETTDTVG